MPALVRPRRPAPVRRRDAAAAVGRLGGSGRSGLGLRCRRPGGAPVQGCGRGASGRADDGDDGSDRHGVALGHGSRLSIPAIGDGTSVSTLSVRDLEQRLVRRHLVADLLEPLGDRALGDGLAELGHLDVGHGWCLVSRSRGADGRAVSRAGRGRSATARSRRTARSDVGCGWMNSATSSTVASQLTAR